MAGNIKNIENHKFKKGQSGNPSGRRKLPDNLKSVVPLTTDELIRTISKHFRMTKEQLDNVLSNDKASRLDMIIAKVIEKAIKTGDIVKAEYLFVRALGKPKFMDEDADLALRNALANVPPELIIAYLRSKINVVPQIESTD